MTDFRKHHHAGVASRLTETHTTASSQGEGAGLQRRWSCPAPALGQGLFTYLKLMALTSFTTVFRSLFVQKNLFKMHSPCSQRLFLNKKAHEIPPLEEGCCINVIKEPISCEESRTPSVGSQPRCSCEHGLAGRSSHRKGSACPRQLPLIGRDAHQAGRETVLL